MPAASETVRKHTYRLFAYSYPVLVDLVGFESLLLGDGPSPLRSEKGARGAR